MTMSPPPSVLCDQDSVPRVWADPVSFDQLIRVLFGQSRPYFSEDPNAARVALTTLYALQDGASGPHRQSLDRELSLLQAAIAKSSMNPVHKDQLSKGRPLTA